eukprot:3078204-Pyramimonas_sp.AAC.1
MEHACARRRHRRTTALPGPRRALARVTVPEIRCRVFFHMGPPEVLLDPFPRAGFSSRVVF